MLRMIPIALLLLLPGLAPRADAGLVQLTLEGEIHETGGALLEIAITLAPKQADGRVSTLNMSLHLAQHTSARDLAELVAQRFFSAGFGPRAWVSGSSAAGASTRAHLFLENPLSVTVRLGGGINGFITLCEDAPESIQILPTRMSPSPAHLQLTFSTRHPHTERLGHRELELDLNAGASSAQVSQLLASKARASGWTGTRPTLETYKFYKVNDGSLIKGCSISMWTDGDWGLRVVLPRP